MHLTALALYSATGAIEVVRFRRGLNVITGSSATGKSALLEMVEYCLGRDTLTTPVGPIRNSVRWYGLLVQLENRQAFVGRPAPTEGNASTQRAMLEFGADLDFPSFADLHVNADTGAVRDQLGRAIGIDENLTEPTGLQTAFEANLGHAVLFCLQRQSEIANREFLFHRQGEEGMARAIQAVFPYFLGAAPRDRAILQQQLLSARRDLRAAEGELRAAEGADEDMTVTLRAFLAEALAAGLLAEPPAEGTSAGLAALAAAVSSQVSEVPLDDEEQAERERLGRRREDLRQQLYQIGQERAVLEALETDEAEYEGVVAQQTARLRSLELIGNDSDEAQTCPICSSTLAEPDPTISELQTAATQLKSQAGAFAVTRPRRRQVLEDVHARADQVRNEIRALDEAMIGIEDARRQVTAGRRFGERQAFLQGRIQRFLETTAMTAPSAIDRLRQRVLLRRGVVDQLDAQLDPEEEREQLISRLVTIGADMTIWAERLGLEHSGTAVRLDPRRLTVVADTASGPAPLNQFGSAANWIGYHLVAHLALHKYFVEQRRPVPSFLFLDQPTQAYYPSDVSRESGIPTTDADREAVQAMFLLMLNVSAELDERLQIIVCDHANLPDDWFQQAVIKNWRHGARLIPDEWIEEPDQP